MKLKLGIISLGSVSSKMLAKEAEEFFEEVDMIDIRKIEINVDKNINVLYDGSPLKEYDCLYMKGSFRYSSLLYSLTEIYKDKCFVPIEANAHIIAHNKFMTHLIFSKNKNIKMPGTYFAAKVNESKNFLKTLNYPIILKFPTGTHGKGVIFTESSKSAISMVDALDVFQQPVLVQDYIDIQSDIRIIVAGDKIIGSMRRIAKKGDVRANAHQGGDAEVYVPTPEIKRMALEAAKTIHAKICAIDLIESDYGPLVLEVNTSPGLQKITQVTKKNIAKEMVKYLFEETKKIKSKEVKIASKDLIGDLGIEDIATRDFETNLKVVSDKIVLPEFAKKLSNFSDGEDVIIKVSNNKIEIVKNNL
jgi:ribosomal protein S6--L-glutamate ligase